MREIEDLAVRIGSLARLGRQRDFSLPRFRKALATIARNGQRGEVLRQLLTDWTGLPFEADEAFARWTEIEQLIPTLRGKLEVRGLGIVDMKTIAEAELVLVADLVDAAMVERMPEAGATVALLGVDVAAIRLVAAEASAPIKLALALARARKP